MLVNDKFILLNVHSGTVCDLYPTEGISHFVTSMSASGWRKITG
jgi:hypothetical protein